MTHLPDPTESLERYYRDRSMHLVACVMKACGVTQVDISRVDLMAHDTLTISEDIEKGFLRIKGEFALEDK